MRVWPGQPYPLGATWDGSGVNFALFSENATAVELCLFDKADDANERSIPATSRAALCRARRASSGRAGSPSKSIT